MRMLKRMFPLMLAGLLSLGMALPSSAAAEDTGFSDVSPDSWYAEAVVYCREHGLMAGVGNGRFEPESRLTRAQLAAVLYRIAGSPAVTGTDAFTDTPDDAWYSDAVLWAWQQGLAGGYGGGRFGPNDPVSREQMTAILWRSASSPAAEGTGGYSDASAVSSYAATAAAWAGNRRIVRPVSGGAFAPGRSATRAQIADALMNYDRSAHSAPSGVPGAGTNVLVAYFSRYGNTDYGGSVDAVTSASVVVEDGRRQGTTELIARTISERTGGDLHLIETVEAYPPDFGDVREQNHREIADGTRPALASRIDVGAYDVIFVGYPVWASTAPAPVLSFLESCALSGKTVIPFCTHDGYGAGSSYSAVRSSSPGAVVEQGLAVEASGAASSERAVLNWLNGLYLPAAETADGTAIRITVDGQELDGVLYDSGMARQFAAQLPQTVSMSNYGGREVYGGIRRAIDAEGEGQLRFEDGDITYCPGNNTVAVFYAQSGRPNLTMTVYPIGKVTSDLSAFPDLPGRVEIAFEVAS